MCKISVSTGEQGIKGRLEEEGRNCKAGQAVRMLDIPADAGHNMGLFEELHGYTNGSAFSEALKKSAATNYGYAGPAFIEKLCSIQDKTPLKHALLLLYPERELRLH